MYKKKILLVLVLLLFITCPGCDPLRCENLDGFDLTFDITGEGQISVTEGQRQIKSNIPNKRMVVNTKYNPEIKAIPAEGWAFDYFRFRTGNESVIRKNPLKLNLRYHSEYDEWDFVWDVVFKKILVLEPVGDKSAEVDEELTFTVSASYLNEGTLYYEAEGLPDGASFDHQEFRWTPAYDQAGKYSVTFKVSDGKLSDEETILITVNEKIIDISVNEEIPIKRNRPPVLNEIGDKIVDEGANLSFAVSASDPDRDELSYSAEDLPDGASFENQEFRWTPAYNQAGEYPVTFRVSDGKLSDEETIVITVNDIIIDISVTEEIPIKRNRPPVLNEIGDKIVDEGANLSFAVSAGDPDEDELSYSTEGLPAGASFDNKTQKFQWSPAYGQAGEYPVTFKVSDGILTDEDTIVITVNDVNGPPVLNEIGNKTVDEGANLSFAVSASDPDRDELSYSAEDLPDGGSFDHQEFRWTPAYNQAGEYSVIFQVSDGHLTDSEEVRIIVCDKIPNHSSGGGSSSLANNPPVFDEIVNKTICEAQNLNFNITASDPDGDTLTYSAEGLPVGATFNNQTQVFQWSPTYDQAGEYSVTFKVSDGKLTDEDTIIITVNNVNRPPVFDEIVNKTVYEAQNLNFNITAGDPDGDILTYSVEVLPVGATFVIQTQEFQWCPTYDQAGEHSVTFRVSDGKLTDEDTIKITVNDVNRPPVLDEIGNKTVYDDGNLTFTVTATDPDGDILTYSTGVLPSGATFDNQTQKFQWCPFSQSGEYSVTFKVSDGKLTDEEIIKISVDLAD